MQLLFIIKNLGFTDISRMVKEVDIYEIALLAYCDRMGRKGANEEVEAQNIIHFFDKTKDICYHQNNK
jgi:hypothetical protein